MRLRVACWSPSTGRSYQQTFKYDSHQMPALVVLAAKRCLGRKPARVSESDARTRRTPNSESFRESSTPCEMFVRFGVDTYTEIRIRFWRSEGEKCCASVPV